MLKNHDGRPAHEATHDNLIATMDIMDGICGQLGIFKTVPTTHPWRAYLYRRQGVDGGSSEELLIIPDDGETTPESASSAMGLLERVPDQSKFVFVDCFDKYGKETSNLCDIIDSTAFWYRISGAAGYGDRLRASPEFGEIARKYVDRRLVQIKETDQGNIERDSVAWWDKDLFREWAENPPGSNNLLIVGERGSGKSWILMKFAWDQWVRHKENPWRVFPAVFLSLKEYSKSLLCDQGIRRSLSYYLYKEAKFRSAGEIYFWEALIESGRVILLLDGFDELSREITDVDMQHHIEMLSGYLPQKCKAIISTRGTVFPSLRKLYSVFAGLDRESGLDGMGQGAFLGSVQPRLLVPKHDLYTLAPFENKDVVKLAESTDAEASNNVMGLVRSKLSVDGTEDEQFVAEQCLELARIPATASYLLGMLTESPRTYLRPYEAALIGPLVSYNLQTNRAIDSFRVKRGSHTESHNIGLEEKIEVLEYIAWYLLESGRVDFDSTYLGEVAIDIPSTGFNAVINDLRSQTVFEFSRETRDLQFRLETIRAYFVARYLFVRLTDPLRVESGIKCLGRHKLDPVGAVAGFLRLFFDHGMLSVKELDEYSFSYSDEDISHIDTGLLERRTLELLADQPGYSAWTRCLSSNLSAIGFLGASIDEANEWCQSPLDLGSESELDEAVLVAGDAQLDPFIIACREEKNADFEMFLNSDLIPVLERCSVGDDGDWEVVFREGERSRNAMDHPLSRNVIHRAPSGEGMSFYPFTNDYHLMEVMENGCFPLHLLDHPVTWVGVFVIAIYCNWKTLRDLPGADPYYRILLDKLGNPRLSRNDSAMGFRLPSVCEWRYASRAEDEGATPWASLLGTERGRRLRDYLLTPLTTTRSVWSNYFNDFGIYGMIGNVREWADNGGDLNSPDPRFDVLGATWRLGEKSFQYGAPGGKLPLPNTNLDVGFRLARSLPPKIVDLVQETQQNKKRAREESERRVE